MHSLARRLLGSGDADDATQEAFIRVWEKLPLYKPDGPFGAWVYRLALNVILRRREAERRPVHSGNDLALHLVPQRATSPDAAIDVVNALAKLDAGMRDVVVLHDIEGYRHEEIAEMLDITIAGSKMRLHRARHILRIYIG